MRSFAILFAVATTLVAASPAADLSDRAQASVLCPCAATESCGCNSVIAGSWCVCSGTSAGTWNAAPCQNGQTCGCGSLGTWGVCELLE